MTKPRNLAARFGPEYRRIRRYGHCCRDITCVCGGDWKSDAFDTCPKYEHHLSEMRPRTLNKWAAAYFASGERVELAPIRPRTVIVETTIDAWLATPRTWANT